MILGHKSDDSEEKSVWLPFVLFKGKAKLI